MTDDGRYELIRWQFKDTSDGWQVKATYRYRTKGEALLAYSRAKIEDGAAPDLLDSKTGEYIA